MITRECRQCGNEFQVPYLSSKRTNCTPKCRGVKSKTRADAGTRKVPWVTVTCPCGKEFEAPPWRAKKAIYHSHECALRDQRKSPEQRKAAERPAVGRPPSSRHINRDGYVIVYVPPEERPASWSTRQSRSKGTQDRDHRVVMRKHLGRDLLPGENVHHINGIRTDNRLENLELWIERRQPKGQRASDVLAWAREIIARYEPIEDKLTPKEPR